MDYSSVYSKPTQCAVDSDDRGCCTTSDTKLTHNWDDASLVSQDLNQPCLYDEKDADLLKSDDSWSSRFGGLLTDLQRVNQDSVHWRNKLSDSQRQLFQLKQGLEELRQTISAFKQEEPVASPSTVCSAVHSDGLDGRSTHPGVETVQQHVDHLITEKQHQRTLIKGIRARMSESQAEISMREMMCAMGDDQGHRLVSVAEIQQELAEERMQAEHMERLLAAERHQNQTLKEEASVLCSQLSDLDAERRRLCDQLAESRDQLSEALSSQDQLHSQADVIVDQVTCWMDQWRAENRTMSQRLDKQADAIAALQLENQQLAGRKYQHDGYTTTVPHPPAHDRSREPLKISDHVRASLFPDTGCVADSSCESCQAVTDVHQVVDDVEQTSRSSDHVQRYQRTASDRSGSPSAWSGEADISGSLQSSRTSVKRAPTGWVGGPVRVTSVSHVSDSPERSSAEGGCHTEGPRIHEQITAFHQPLSVRSSVASKSAEQTNKLYASPESMIYVKVPARNISTPAMFRNYSQDALSTVSEHNLSRGRSGSSTFPEEHRHRGEHHRATSHFQVGSKDSMSSHFVRRSLSESQLNYVGRQSDSRHVICDPGHRTACNRAVRHTRSDCRGHVLDLLGQLPNSTWR